VGGAVEAGVAGADLALPGELYFSGVGHGVSLAEGLGGRQYGTGCSDLRC
jgi:hypothetical protein